MPIPKQLSENDLLSIIIYPVIQISSEMKNKSNEFGLSDENKAKCLEKSINILNNYPLIYKVKFNIPLFSGDIVVEKNEVKLRFDYGNKVFSYTQDVGRALNQVSSQLNKDTEMSIKGYVLNSENNTTNKVISHLKIFLERGISLGLFIEEKDNKKHSDGLLTPLMIIQKVKTIPNFEYKIFSEEGEEIVTFKIPDNLSSYILSLRINNDSDYIKEIKEKSNDEKLCKYIDQCCVINERKDYGYIKTACEWLLDSKINYINNKTLSLLQVCFGFEALFGPDNEESKSRYQILSTMKLKSSYLLGDTINLRKEIDEKIGYIYSIRSKLVHGEISVIDHNDLKILDWGINTLSIAIRSELSKFLS